MTLRQYSERIVLAAVSLLVLATLGTTARAAEAPGDVLRRYLRARLTGDIETARTLWNSRDVRRSSALGIRFDDIEASFDDYWMLSAEEREDLAAATTLVFVDSTIEEERATFTVAMKSRSGDEVRDTLLYSVQARSDAWTISLPYLSTSRAWTRREGRYFRLRSKRLARVSQHALNAMDAAIVEVFDRLGTPDAARLRLERVKIEYYLCEEPEDVRTLVGSEAREGYLPAGGRVVSRVCPDMNAVARLLVHLTLRQTPLHNVPLFERGLAAALGGTDDVTSSVFLVRSRNKAIADPKWVDAVFAPVPIAGDEEQAGNARAVEALWCYALMEELQADAFVVLLRELGGTTTQVAARSSQDVRAAIEAATSKSGSDLNDLVRRRAQSMLPAMRPGCETWPTEIFGLEATLRWRDREGAWALKGYVHEDHYIMTVSPFAPGPPQWKRSLLDSMMVETTGEKPEWTVAEPVRPEGDPPTVVLLVRVKAELDLEPYESLLFREHYLARRYKNELFGLFVSPDDARLYDYGQNKVLAEFDTRTSPPGGPFYYDEEPGHVCVSFPTDFFPRALTSYYVELFPYTGE
ncbi:MAG: hypothetical protein JSW67_12380 [Candidatus Latescibacterota bacterium]|nr:MAG: hypothetical protein JSW67_12380 [Candidatus Latescibacterota bacterium]